MSTRTTFLLQVVVLFVAASILPAQTPPRDPIVLKGSAVGKVRFDHVSHLKVAAKCEICHHPSKPEKPLNSPQQACTDCHTRPAKPPVTTSRQAAFHNATATAGLCITCHKTENEQGKSAPARCPECHKPDKSAG